MRPSSRGVSEEPTRGAVWQKVRTGTRKELHKGAWVTNASSGARVRDEAHYHSSGAKALAASRFLVVGATDRIQYELDQG